jgi:hypothetical protein
MAKFTLTDAYVSVNGTAISDHLSSVTVESSADEIEFTSFGTSGFREFGSGLKDATVSAEAFQDFAAASLDAILYPLYNTGGTFALEVRPTSSAASSTNPKYTMTSRLFSYSPIAGAVGDASTTSLVFRNAGTAGLVRGTS